MKLKSSKIILVIMLFALVVEAYSNPVDAELAKRVALNFEHKSRNISKTISDVVIEQFEGFNSFYVVNFREGGWVMTSADDTTVPVLAFSLDDTYRIEDEKPDGFLFLIEDYKEQIDVSRKMGSSRSNEVIEMWNQLMIDDGGSNQSRQSTPSNTRGYTPGTNLLNVSGRGEVNWGQAKNNSSIGTTIECNPSYNSEVKKKWYQGWFSSCDCGAPPVGCGAVALGQVLWYWKWPLISKYRSYNWSLMPNILDNSTPSIKAEEVAKLLLDCAEATNTTYACLGSYTGNIAYCVESALNDVFNYSDVKTVRRSNYSLGGWNNLIRAEIDSERPVIMYGCKSWTFDKKHYFVADGYDAANPNHFHINFGWRGNFNGHYYLDNINPGSDNFSDKQRAIINIYAPPVISGAKIICSGSNSNFSATNWQDGHTWDKSSNLNLSNTTTSTVTVSKKIIGLEGPGWVSIKNSSGVELTSFKLWVGTPHDLDLYINGIWRSNSPAVYSFRLGSSSYPYENTTIVEWKIYASSTVAFADYEFTSSFDTGTYSFPLSSYGYTYWAAAKLVNTCGQGAFTPRQSFTVTAGNHAEPEIQWSFPYPNPASDVIYIEIDQEAYTQAKASEQTLTDATVLKTFPTFDIRLYEWQGNLVHQATSKGSKVEFNVANLPNGIYFLHVYESVSSKPEIHQIVIER